jgi:putative nucleotidyltransferase with HDIG domain
VHRLLQLCESPDASAEQVAAVLREDQALVARILRVANSTYYGVSGRITEISRAVVMLGSVKIRDLVVAICARHALVESPPAPEHELMWRHSVAAATASALVAEHAGNRAHEQAFIAGLLHDIGRLAMLAFEPARFRQLLRELGGPLGPLTLERRHFGLDHAEVGYRVMRHWGLPDALCRVTLEHHDHHLFGRNPCMDLRAVVILGDVCAHLMGLDGGVPTEMERRAEAAMARLEMSEGTLQQALDQFDRRVGEMMAHIMSAEAAIDEPVRGTALWVCGDGGAGGRLEQLVLRHRGFEVRAIGPAQAECWPGSADLVVVALGHEEQAQAEQLSLRLAARGMGAVVMLADPRDGGQRCRHDRLAGTLLIPRGFTIQDLRWVEAQVRGAVRKAG